eukprot:TRINITY_DN34535_c0_g1_i2.p3 TRINITY_DN34535_c0_g1~~TRINITY_DN34535_c0_g1_i2.p3  ORF type:complete len:142 (-),score=25.84 TRINITY_DN34535_c0_g1_i2:410-835(-)
MFVPTETTKEEAIQKTQLVANKVKKYFLKFKDVSYSTTVYQCVFILIHEDEEVMSSNKVAREVFTGSSEGPPYMPHVSLVYSDMDEETRKKVVVEAVNDLYGPKADNLLVDTGFWVEEIALWETEPNNPESWTLTQTFQLQ